MSELPRRALLLSGLGSLAACQAPVPAPVVLGPHRASFMVFRAPINPQTRDFFIADVTKSIDAGATEVIIGINSPGGVIPAAEAMLTFMDRMHTERNITFTTFNVGLVASAACYVFLAGQRRFSTPRGAFLFHQASFRPSTAVTAQTVHEAAAYMDGEERHFLDILKTRTRLSEGEALSFVRRTVILNADEARRDGITDGTRDFVVPNGVNPIDIRNTEDKSPLPLTRPPA